MSDERINQIVQQNLIRMVVHDFLLLFNRDNLALLPRYFDCWKSGEAPKAGGDFARIYRLCDFIRSYYSYDFRRPAPEPELLKSVYFGAEETTGVGLLGEDESSAVYRVKTESISLAEATARLQEEGFHSSSHHSRMGLDLASLAVTCRLPVLLTGETGTGKRRLARLIHRLSNDATKPLIFISASDINSAILRNRFAVGGTLALIEVNRMSPAMQRTLYELSGDFPASNSARIISTSTTDLAGLTGEGSFLPELFYRLSLITVQLPPLRERLDELEEIIGYFIQRYRDSNRNFTAGSFDTEALMKMREHYWQGNFKELQAVVRRSVMACPDRIVTPEYVTFSSEDIKSN